MSILKPFPDQWLKPVDVPSINDAIKLPKQLIHFKDEQQQKLARLSLPNRKTENWRYSSGHIKIPTSNESQTAVEASNVINLNPEQDESWLDESLKPGNQIHIRMTDGEFVSEASQSEDDDLSEKIIILSFAELDEAQATYVANTPSNQLENMPFATLNGAHFDDGLFVHILGDIPSNTLIHLHHHCRHQQVAAPRIIIQVENGANVSFVETYTADDLTEDDQVQDNRLITTVTDIRLCQNAKLNYIRQSLEPETTSHVGLTYVELYENSRLESHCAGFGGKLRRHDLKVRLLEPNAECLLNGITLTKNRQHYDNHTEIEHIAPHCNSEENYRCIAADQSHIVFNGRIHIHPGAQKTSGAMSNKNLLLSSSAEIDTKPELEIYADDVKCAHGATVGELDQEEIYYLRTRGIDKHEAATLLTMAFIMELVMQIPDDHQQALIEERLNAFIESVFANEALIQEAP
jgi:Fe-S cluster assembly protein SufD